MLIIGVSYDYHGLTTEFFFENGALNIGEMIDDTYSWDYPLVNWYITMENHNV